MDGHLAAIRSAERMNAGMGRLFAGLGTAAHPRGSVLTAYRGTRRELRVILAEQQRAARLSAAREALGGLRVAVAVGVGEALAAAQALGAEEAARQLAAYGVEVAGRSSVLAQQQGQEALQAVLATVDSQIGQAEALIATGAGPEMVIGDEERQGVVAPALTLSQAWYWIGALALGSWAWIAGNWRPAGMAFRKQAVAALDERTTDCCLRVHGQVVDLDKAFHLTGQPRFAQYVDNPPFHWSCRTATALVRPQDAGDELTQAMIDAARAELAARAATGKRVEIHPASALSRR